MDERRLLSILSDVRNKELNITTALDLIIDQSKEKVKKHIVVDTLSGAVKEKLNEIVVNINPFWFPDDKPIHCVSKSHGDHVKSVWSVGEGGDWVMELRIPMDIMVANAKKLKGDE